MQFIPRFIRNVMCYFGWHHHYRIGGVKPAHYPRYGGCSNCGVPHKLYRDK